MATLAKLLKDSNGNTIFPKTRAEWVYMSNNRSVTTHINNLVAKDTELSNRITTNTNSINSLTTKVNGIIPVNSSQIIHVSTHAKSGTTHNITPSTTLPTSGIAHLSFIATANFITGDIIKIGNVVYTPKSITMEALSQDIFKSGALINLDLNVSNKTCFFKSGGVGGPPKEPTNNVASYQIIQAFTANTTWTVPETKWYRIIAIGKSGNGGNGGGSQFSNRYGGDGAGGNCGGLSCSTLLLNKGETIQITVNSSMTSFGPNITATVGGNGGNGGYYSESSGGPDGAVSTQIGDGFGGNKINITGMKGYGGWSTVNQTYPSWGGWFQSDIAYINQYFIPADRRSTHCAPGKPGGSYYNWVNLAVQLSGGGGGGNGGRSDLAAGAGGIGQPGVCIIEKAVK